MIQSKWEIIRNEIAAGRLLGTTPTVHISFDLMEELLDYVESLEKICRGEE
jgi:hypothetical protein